jgi:hypothetical protein
MHPIKAYAAFALAFLTAMLAQVADKTQLSDLTPLQWVICVASAVVTAGTVYVVPKDAAILGR